MARNTRWACGRARPRTRPCVRAYWRISRAAACARTASLRVILDGALALHKAVRAVFGEAALIQRCQVHTLRNILDHLPERQRPVGPGDRAACLSGERREDGDAAPHGSRQAPGGRISQRRRQRPRRAGRNADRPHAAPLDPPAAVTRHDQRRRESAESHPPREAQRETVAWWTDDAAVGGHRCPRSRQGLPAPEGMRRYAAVGSRPNAASTADGSCAAVATVAPNPGARGGIRTGAIERTNASNRITASRAWRIAVPFHVNPPDSLNRPHLSDEAQDPDGARGGCAHGPAPPPDAPGFQIRERDPHVRRSQAYRLAMRSRCAKPGPGHAGPPDKDLYWRTLRVCGQSAPTRVGRGAPSTRFRPPGGTRRRRTTSSSVLATRQPTWRTRPLAARRSRRAARTSLGARRLAVRPPPRSRCARSRRR